METEDITIDYFGKKLDMREYVNKIEYRQTNFLFTHLKI